MGYGACGCWMRSAWSARSRVAVSPRPNSLASNGDRVFVDPPGTLPASRRRRRAGARVRPRSGALVQQPSLAVPKWRSTTTATCCSAMPPSRTSPAARRAAASDPLLRSGPGRALQVRAQYFNLLPVGPVQLLSGPGGDRFERGAGAVLPGGGGELCRLRQGPPEWPAARAAPPAGNADLQMVVDDDLSDGSKKVHRRRPTSSTAASPTTWACALMLETVEVVGCARGLPAAACSMPGAAAHRGDRGERGGRHAPGHRCQRGCSRRSRRRWTPSPSIQPHRYNADTLQDMQQSAWRAGRRCCPRRERPVQPYFIRLSFEDVADAAVAHAS